jgi:predicted AlkP superfamily pyrophosphatase or phosphodiesterase
MDQAYTIDESGERPTAKIKQHLLRSFKHLFFFLLVGCASGADSGANRETAPYAYAELPYNEAIANKHVVLMALDGWGAYSLPKADMPVVKRMMREGSYSLKTLSVFPSNSGPNWTSLFMGASPKEHGYIHPKNQPFEFRSATRDQYGFFPTIFAALKGQRPESAIAYFYEWDEIGGYCPDAVLDRKEHIPHFATTREAVEAVGEYIKTTKPTLTLIALDEPDHVGHSSGHGSKAYYAALRWLDQLVGIIEEAVKAAGIYEDTVFVLTSDHGGMFFGHGNNTLRDRQIPLILFGSGIKQGHVISRKTNIYDIAPTIAAIFQLVPPPAWKGRSITEIFDYE